MSVVYSDNWMRDNIADDVKKWSSASTAYLISWAKGQYKEYAKICVTQVQMTGSRKQLIYELNSLLIKMYEANPAIKKVTNFLPEVIFATHVGTDEDLIDKLTIAQINIGILALQKTIN